MTEGHIDKSVHIPKGEQVLLQARIDRGDFGMNVDKYCRHAPAKVGDPKIIDRLIKEGYLEHHHQFYGLSFLELKHAWLAKLSYKPNSIYNQVLHLLGSTPAAASELFDHICREIGGPNSRLICRAMEDPMDSSSSITGNAYRLAFDRLTEVMDRLRDEAEKKVLAEGEASA